LRQRQCVAHMIKMSVRQKDRLGSRAAAEARFRRLYDLLGASGKPGVNQRPRSARVTDKKDIYKADRQPADIRRNAFDRLHRGCSVIKSLNLWVANPFHGMVSVSPTFKFCGSSILSTLAS